MDVMVSTDKILEAAHAFGLKGDTLGKASTQDRFGKLVDATTISVGFVTKIVRVPKKFVGSAFALALEQSYVTLGESVIADHDATSAIVVDPADWQKLAPASKLLGVAGRLVPALADKKVHEFQNYFFTNDATFVATELRGIPERLTLHIAERRFDIDYIIDRLREHRAHHPLPTISEMSRAYTVLQ